MTPLIQSILAVGAVSLISVIGLATLSLNQALLKKALFLLVALAAGALIGDAFVHLIPEAFSHLSTSDAALAVIGGILTFFLLEKFLHWHHSHGETEFAPEHGAIHPVGPLVLISDGVHNFVDGLAIGAAFLVSPEAGIATAIAIALHEIPQEIGDFGLLIHAGYTRTKALLYNFGSALTAFLGLAVAFFTGEWHEGVVPLIAAFTAGMFIYIALADLVPELHKTTRLGRSLLQLAVITAGVALMFGLTAVEGDSHGHGSLTADGHTEERVHETHMETMHGEDHTHHEEPAH